MTLDEVGAPRDDFERELVGLSLALPERLALQRARPEAFETGDGAREWLRRWRERLGPDAAALGKRLAWDGLTAEQVLPALGRVAWPDDWPVPEWLPVLREALCEMERPAALPADWQGIPFAGYWVPFVAVGTRRAAARAGRAWERLAPSAVAALQRSLARELARCGWRALYDEFNGHRWSRLGSAALFLQGLGLPLGSRLYEGFLAQRLGAGRYELCARLPGLARLLGTRVAWWARATAELLLRLDRDAARLRETFGFDVARLADVEAGLADPHDGARCVLALSFASGGRLVYKPRDLSCEAAFQALLRELPGDAPGPAAVEVLSCGDYGWEQHVSARPPAGPEESLRYLEASGALLAVLHLLRAVDCHHENVLPLGDRPALVDAETLLAPSAPGAGSGGLAARLEESVLRTALVPGWRPARGGRSEDVSALGFSGVGEGLLRWRELNGDGMLLERGVPPVAGEAAPVLPPNVQAEAVQRGFRSAHAWLAGKRSQGELQRLLAPFRGVLVRVVARGTQTYQELLQDSLSPEALRHGLERSLRLERLATGLLDQPERPASWPLLAEEQRALFAGDVPRFVALAAETRLASRDPAQGTLRPLPGSGHLAESGVAVLERAVAGLDQRDLELQLRLIEGCFVARAATSYEVVPPAPRAGEALPAPAAGDLLLLREEGLTLARGLAQAALLDERGQAAWLGLEFDPQWRVFRMGLVGPSLYGGSAGIALFLAAAFAVSREEPLRQTARAALAPLCEAVALDAALLARQMPLGGFSGLGGLLFALAQASHLLEQPELAESAVRLAAAVAPATLDRDLACDVTAGAAGAILGAASLQRVAPSEAALRLVALAARHLERRARPLEPGVGWGPEGQDSLCGMAHGNAGIALALLEAFRLIGNDAWRRLAGDAVAWERRHRLDEQANWRDLRPDAPAGAPLAAWCHGAPGIGLARARMLEIHDSPDWHEDLRLAIEGTLRADSRAGHLCCGAAGLDEALLELGRRTHDDTLVARARARGLERARRARHQGWTIRPGIPTHVSAPGLMQGLAGIGYGLLRLTTEGLLPALLSLGPAER